MNQYNTEKEAIQVEKKLGSIVFISQDQSLSLESVQDYAAQPLSKVKLDELALKARIEQNRQYLDNKLANQEDIYGVTTGFGNSASNRISTSLSEELQQNLIAYHGCGVGDYLSESDCAATLLIRMNCNAKGFSGVSWELLAQMETFLNNRIIPAIPSMGSVGASGDLTPLSYVGAALGGKRKVYYQGQLRDTAEVLEELNIAPYKLKPKEGLAIMNGTSVMSAIATNALKDIRRGIDLSCKLIALYVELIEGRASPFHKRVHELKPHRGQQICAEKILERLTNVDQRLGRRNRTDDNIEFGKQETFRLQDSYSIRCSPQVLGPLIDAEMWASQILTTEINSVNDNPLFDDENDLILNAGHFYGGHVAAVCDTLKPLVANMGALLERELGILVDDRLNGGISNNLVAREDLGDKAWVHHGFKAMQITSSSLVAEALKNAGPMSVFSRTTEALNQDIVSMGTIAARDLRRIADLIKPVIAIQAMAIRQAFYVDGKDAKAEKLNALSREFFDEISSNFQPVIEDRPMDVEINNMVNALFNEQ
ncbi:aromatic amino acid ammonia-lyase [Pseudoalteromonas piscicida]|uniref:Histidine ammonia-lyase n=1 Tax=Pseudoalteromonas piscicida TaxID=43662 RepID=A0ABM6NAA1_PSEO7|nr:aromatic amino acid ammonia-lyase [Pseudoalteromonas piscicida]ATD05731.1 histidine ammonia-lyase [Pseudoalteromonas piscicida]WPU32518.1 aromatic amino acid ammonia-lyase [Pseudoalteromonas piscicida]